MNYLEGLILNCLKQLNGERTIYSIYHLFKGKKSSQTIQDAHLYALTKYFAVYPTFSREILEEVIKTAAENNWIAPSADQRYLLTEAGETVLQIFNKEYSTPLYLNGWKYHQIDRQFWERLSFFIQVISNLVFEETNYIPIQKNKDVHNWVKSYLQKNNIQRISIGRNLFDEIVHCLEAAECLDPFILIFRLTGFKRIGLTSTQTAEMLKMEFIHYQLEFLNIIHFIIQEITSHSGQYPILCSILEKNKEKRHLTISSQKTYELLEKGYSIDEITLLRRLKKSTIEDHIVEIALNIDTFSIDPYIDKKIQSQILSAARQTASKELKLIRSRVLSATYFEIRLALAKYGVE